LHEVLKQANTAPTTSSMIPLGISFFTFTQIAFLVDSYKYRFQRNDFINYSLFVTYFPHLISGPIISFRDIYPQLTKPDKFRLNWTSINTGILLISMGLFKKIILADELGTFVNPVFDQMGSEQNIAFLQASGGLLSYSFQLYFDFSGYCDMAVGISRLFGVHIPFNFNSPYKATSIIDFWRRWHITLSQFLKEYLYIPLGGNRCTPIRNFLNLVITMVLGGIWHGASWTFLLWGLLHGVFLSANHLWKRIYPAPHFVVHNSFAIGCTFCLICLGWVFFRSPDIATAISIFKGLSFHSGLGLAEMKNIAWQREFSLILLSMTIVWFLPNSMQVCSLYESYLTKNNKMMLMATALGSAGAVAFSLSNLNKVSYFLYSQF
jgi:alginate O-acetyltransferase complex protein AlgI